MRGFRSEPTFLFFWRCFPIANAAEYQINEEIRDREVRLIAEDGVQLGIMSSAEALKVAEERGYDLVKIAGNSNPPVCKLMDYGKYRFEQSKRDKEARHNQHVVEVKEIVDEAIRRVRKKNLTHFFDVLLGKRYDKEDMIILGEREFA